MSYADDPELRQSLHRWQVLGVLSLFALVMLFPLSRMVESEGRAAAVSGMSRSTVALGRTVFADNCANCHGEQGQGVDSPALNSSQFFEEATEERIYRLAATGVPGTTMQAWAQELGGPLTDEHLRAVAAFIMTWEQEAPDVPDWRTKFLGTPPPMSGMNMTADQHDTGDGLQGGNAHD